MHDIHLRIEFYINQEGLSTVVIYFYSTPAARAFHHPQFDFLAIVADVQERFIIHNSIIGQLWLT